MPREPHADTSHASRDSAGDPAALANFLRSLADQVERDPHFGARVVALARESGLLMLADAGVGSRADSASAHRGTRRARTSKSPPGSPARGSPDPFALLREQGEGSLRAELALLDLATLRATIRTHRLDPARVSARWTARDRLIELIVDQVRARANHGKAFERV
jgi:hypothetical protein